MRTPRTAVVALAMVLSSAVPAAAAPDCDGGSVRSLRVSPTRLRFEGSFTRPEVQHSTLLTGGASFHFELTSADDPATVLYAVTIPATEFVTRGNRTKYNGLGTFSGRISLRNSKKQSDTVVVSLRVADTIVGAGVDRDLRASITAGSRCGRTCVSPCALKGGKLRCKSSVGYQPFAGEGFGGYLSSPPAATSPLCGLAIDPNPDCDFLIEERCV